MDMASVYTMERMRVKRLTFCVAVLSSLISSIMTITMACQMIGKDKDWLAITIGAVLELGKFVLLANNFHDIKDTTIRYASKALAYSLVVISIAASVLHVHGRHTLGDEMAAIERSRNESLKNQARSVETQIETLMNEYKSLVEMEASTKKTKMIDERARILRQEHDTIISKITHENVGPKNHLEPIVMIMMAVCLELLSIVSINMLHVQPSTTQEVVANEAPEDYSSYTASMIAEDIAMGKVEPSYKPIMKKYKCGTRKARAAIEESTSILRKMRRL